MQDSVDELCRFSPVSAMNSKGFLFILQWIRQDFSSFRHNRFNLPHQPLLSNKLNELTETEKDSEPEESEKDDSQQGDVKKEKEKSSK